MAEGVDDAGPTAAFGASATGYAGVLGRRPEHHTAHVGPTRRHRERDGGTGGPYMNVALSPDGRQAAADRFDRPAGIWLLDRARGTSTRATSGGGSYRVDAGLGSRRDAPSSSRRRIDTPPNLYVKRIGASGDDERLFRSRLQSFPQSWSPDGRFIAYVTVDPKTVLRHLDTAVSGNRQPTSVSPNPVQRRSP